MNNSFPTTVHFPDRALNPPFPLGFVALLVQSAQCQDMEQLRNLMMRNRQLRHHAASAKHPTEEVEFHELTLYEEFRFGFKTVLSPIAQLLSNRHSDRRIRQARACFAETMRRILIEWKLPFTPNVFLAYASSVLDVPEGRYSTEAVHAHAVMMLDEHMLNDGPDAARGVALKIAHYLYDQEKSDGKTQAVDTAIA